LDINSRINFDLGVFSFFSESVSVGFKEKNADSEPDISAARKSKRRTNKIYKTVEELNPHSTTRYKL
jgi:hypothetical protein